MVILSKIVFLSQNSFRIMLLMHFSLILGTLWEKTWQLKFFFVIQPNQYFFLKKKQTEFLKYWIKTNRKCCHDTSAPLTLDKIIKMRMPNLFLIELTILLFSKLRLSIKLPSFYFVDANTMVVWVNYWTEMARRVFYCLSILKAASCLSLPA